jgi:hypothetical protein
MFSLPTELTTFAWQQAPESTLVIRHGDDHTSILSAFPTPVRIQGSLTIFSFNEVDRPAAAAGDVARNFLRTGVMPGPRSNKQVTVIGPGGTRGPVPGAYDVPTGAVAGDISSVENIV